VIDFDAIEREMRQRKEKYINNLNNEYKAKIAKQHKVLDF